MGGESAALRCLLTTPSVEERRMHAKWKDKVRPNREEEDEYLLFPLVGVGQGKAEEAFVEEEE